MSAPEFNSEWVAKSMSLVLEPGYLDRLSAVYRVDEALPRDVDAEKLRRVKEAYESGDDHELLGTLLRLDKFPYDETFARLFKLPNQGFNENPTTVNRIVRRIRGMSWDELEKAIKVPKVANRQMGSRFSEWFAGKGYEAVPANDLLPHSDSPKFVKGEKEATEFAKEHLGYAGARRPDLLVKVRETYVVGEAKFFTDTGGNQNNQFKAAMDLVESSFKPGVCPIAIMDGLIWKEGNSANYRKLRSTKHDVMSVLLLPEYLERI